MKARRWGTGGNAGGRHYRSEGAGRTLDACVKDPLLEADDHVVDFAAVGGRDQGQSRDQLMDPSEGVIPRVPRLQ